MKSRCFKLYRAYSLSFNSSKLGNFFWSWILKDCIEVQKKKKKVVALQVHALHKTWNKAFSRHSRAVTGECTKKRDARAELLFFQSKLIAFLPFSLTSQSSLLKLLHDKLRRPHCSFSLLSHYIVSSFRVAGFCLLMASIINEVSLSTKGSSCKQDQARGADRRIGR